MGLHVAAGVCMGLHVVAHACMHANTHNVCARICKLEHKLQGAEQGGLTQSLCRGPLQDNSCHLRSERCTGLSE